MSLSVIMSHAGLSWYAEIALVIFLLAFIMVAWQVFSPRNRSTYQRFARIPLDDEHVVSHQVQGDN